MRTSYFSWLSHDSQSGSGRTKQVSSLHFFLGVTCRQYIFLLNTLNFGSAWLWPWNIPWIKRVTSQKIKLSRLVLVKIMILIYQSITCRCIRTTWKRGLKSITGQASKFPSRQALKDEPTGYCSDDAHRHRKGRTWARKQGKKRWNELWDGETREMLRSRRTAWCGHMMNWQPLGWGGKVRKSKEGAGSPQWVETCTDDRKGCRRKGEVAILKWGADTTVIIWSCQQWPTKAIQFNRFSIFISFPK